VVDVLEYRRFAVALDAAGHAPWLDDPVGRPADRPRQLHVSLEAGCTAIEEHECVDVCKQRQDDGIDREPYADAAIVARRPPGNPIGIMRAGDDNRSLALDRAGKRAQLALELELVQDETRAARRIGEDGATIDHIEPLDRDHVEVDADRADRPLDPT